MIRMCGRAYETYTDDELELRYFAKRKLNLALTPNFNLAPTQMSPIIRMREGEVAIELSKWGLIAFKPKPGEKSSFAPINAKSETIDEKPMFKSSFLQRRCIVPVSGFYEWKKIGDKKQPYAIHGANEPILSFAGIYQEIELPGGEMLDTFAILTTEPNPLMAQIHDRMPVILDRAGEKTWLNPDSKPSELKKLFVPSPSEWLKSYPVSTLVNSPRNNSENVLAPLK